MFEGIEPWRLYVAGGIAVVAVLYILYNNWPTVKAMLGKLVPSPAATVRPLAPSSLTIEQEATLAAFATLNKNVGRSNTATAAALDTIWKQIGTDLIENR